MSEEFKIRKLKIMEHISLDDMIQASGEEDFLTAT